MTPPPLRGGVCPHHKQPGTQDRIRLSQASSLGISMSGLCCMKVTCLRPGSSRANLACVSATACDFTCRREVLSAILLHAVTKAETCKGLLVDTQAPYISCKQNWLSVSRVTACSSGIRVCNTRIMSHATCSAISSAFVFVQGAGMYPRRMRSWLAPGGWITTAKPPMFSLLLPSLATTHPDRSWYASVSGTTQRLLS